MNAFTLYLSYDVLCLRICNTNKGGMTKLQISYKEARPPLPPGLDHGTAGITKNTE